MEIFIQPDNLIYSTYVDDPTKYKAYDLYSMKVWVLRELRRMDKEPKFEIFIITHGTDENTNVNITHAEVVTPEFYGLCDLSFSLYHDYTIESHQKSDSDNITIFDEDVLDKTVLEVYDGVKSPEDVSHITVDLYYEGNKVILPKEHTDHINKYIRSNVDNFKFIPILEFDDELYTNKGDILPTSWVSSMLRFINLSVPWRLDNIGLLVNLESQVDPTDTLSGIYNNLISRLSEMYYFGYIYSPPKNLTKLWNIKSIGTDGLHHIDISDKLMRRISDTYRSPVDFILSRIYGVNHLDYEIGDNVLIRHMIAKVLESHQIRMIGKKVRVVISNYEDAIKVMDDIDGVISTTYPDIKIDVAPLAVPTNDLLSEDSVMYSTDDVDRPWYLSIVTLVS